MNVLPVLGATLSQLAFLEESDPHSGGGGGAGWGGGWKEENPIGERNPDFVAVPCRRK